jgi:hypothetical protein
LGGTRGSWPDVRSVCRSLSRQELSDSVHHHVVVAAEEESVVAGHLNEASSVNKLGEVTSTLRLCSGVIQVVHAIKKTISSKLQVRGHFLGRHQRAQPAANVSSNRVGDESRPK